VFTPVYAEARRPKLLIDWRVSPYNTYTRQGGLPKVLDGTAKVFT